MLTIEFFSMIFIRKGKKERSLYQNKVNLSLTFTQRLGLLFSIITIIWSILKNKNDKVYETV